MKNKGFTLTELLVVISIITVLMGLALVGISKYRIMVVEKDLNYLHATMETNYNNYRSDITTNGGVVLNSIVIGFNDDSYKKYINGLTYDGKRLSYEDIKGSIIELHTKGEVLNNNEYKKDAHKRAKKLNGTVEDIYVIDATCLVKSGVDKNNIKETCVSNGNDYSLSVDDLVCIRIKYKNGWIIDDFGKDKEALSINKLCKYVVNYEE